MHVDIIYLAYVGGISYLNAICIELDIHVYLSFKIKFETINTQNPKTHSMT